MPRSRTQAPNQTVDEGTLVELDATGSSDPDGDMLSYAWTEPVALSDSNRGGCAQ